MPTQPHPLFLTNYHTSMTNTTAHLSRMSQIQIQANLTFTLLLTLKMTAAKAVKTSVISTNSLSQDYTNLDDQLPQTCQLSDYCLTSQQITVWCLFLCIVNKLLSLVIKNHHFLFNGTVYKDAAVFSVTRPILQNGF